MAFSPFAVEDFESMGTVTAASHPQALEDKINQLRQDLGAFPEFRLDFFRKRVVRRPAMRGEDGLVFGHPRWYDAHWFLFVVGGDQDQVQFNIGMFREYIRVGLGFQIGMQVTPKIPAFQVFQTFLGVRPPLPFRDAFYQVVKRNQFQIEDEPPLSPERLIRKLETHVIPPDESAVFVFIGSMWKPDEAVAKSAGDFRRVFLELMPFYEELLLAGGRYTFHPD